MSDIEIREIRADEHERVGRLVVAAYDAVGEFGEPYRSFLADPSAWVPGTTATFVAVRDDEVVGAVGFTLPGDAEFEGMEPPVGDAGFRFLSVSPDAQGGGVGRALVDRCIDEARLRGARRLAIHSMVFMTAAHRLYERRGFDRRPDMDVRFPSGVGIGFTLDLVPDAGDHFPAPGPAPDDPPWYEDVWGPTEESAEEPHPIC